MRAVVKGESATGLPLVRMSGVTRSGQCCGSAGLCRRCRVQRTLPSSLHPSACPDAPTRPLTASMDSRRIVLMQSSSTSSIGRLIGASPKCRYSTQTTKSVSSQRPSSGQRNVKLHTVASAQVKRLKVRATWTPSGVARDRIVDRVPAVALDEHHRRRQRFDAQDSALGHGSNLVLNLQTRWGDVTRLTMYLATVCGGLSNTLRSRMDRHNFRY